MCLPVWYVLMVFVRYGNRNFLPWSLSYPGLPPFGFLQTKQLISLVVFLFCKIQEEAIASSCLLLATTMDPTRTCEMSTLWQNINFELFWVLFSLYRKTITYCVLTESCRVSRCEMAVKKADKLYDDHTTVAKLVVALSNITPRYTTASVMWPAVRPPRSSVWKYAVQLCERVSASALSGVKAGGDEQELT